MESHHDLIPLSEHDLRANAFRVCREGKPVSTFPDHALAAPGKPEEAAAPLRTEKPPGSLRLGALRPFSRRLDRRNHVRSGQGFVWIQTDREQQVCLVGSPAITDAEIDRLRAAK